MATAASRQARFYFHCEKDTRSYHHNIPANLVTADANSVPNYRDAFTSAMLPIMGQHKAECIKLSPPTCGVCEKAPVKEVLLTPMSYLHVVHDPLVNVLVTPVCEKKKCAVDGNRELQALIAQVTAMEPGKLVAAEDLPAAPAQPSRGGKCPCGSRRKYKKCCGADEVKAS